MINSLDNRDMFILVKIVTYDLKATMTYFNSKK